MKNRIIIALISAFSMISLVYAATDQVKLIAVYNKFRKVASSGSEEELSKYMSARFLNTTKNNYASAGIVFGEEQVREYAGYEDISKGTFVKMIENGPTIGLIMNIPTTDMEGKRPLTQFIFMKFLKEDTGWKFDGYGTTTKHKFDENGKPTKYTDSMIPDRFVIDGKLPEVPTLLPLAEIPAVYFIMTQGYSVSMSINGNTPIIVDEGSRSALIIGGLKNGNNEVVYTITKRKAKAYLYPKMTISYADKDGNEVNAFEHESGKDETGTFKKQFTAVKK